MSNGAQRQSCSRGSSAQTRAPSLRESGWLRACNYDWGRPLRQVGGGDPHCWGSSAARPLYCQPQSSWALNLDGSIWLPAQSSQAGEMIGARRVLLLLLLDGGARWLGERALHVQLHELPMPALVNKRAPTTTTAIATRNFAADSCIVRARQTQLQVDQKLFSQQSELRCIYIFS